MTAALKGIRIADFSHVVAGPYCALILSDLGAEVIKIESPKGDATRGYMPPDLAGESPAFLTMNRGKQGIVLDLGREEGRQIAREIVANSDVVLENFATGVMQRWGLDYATLANSHPRLIYCSISAYGRSGPYADRAGYDPVIQAEAGFMSLNGDPNGEPQRTGIPFIDLTTGMFAAHAILAALYARKDSGLGQFIDVPLFDNAVNLTTYYSMGYLIGGVNPQRLGNKSPVVVPSDVFDAQDGKFYMTVAGEGVWRKLVNELGNPPELQSEEYASNSVRMQNEAGLKRILQQMFGREPLSTLIQRLRAAGVPAGPIRSIAEVVDSPEARERGIIGKAPHTGAGSVPNLRLPMAMSGTPLVAPRGAPLLGEHTRAVLSGLLKYSPERITELMHQGVIKSKEES